MLGHVLVAIFVSCNILADKSDVYRTGRCICIIPVINYYQCP